MSKSRLIDELKGLFSRTEDFIYFGGVRKARAKVKNLILDFEALEEISHDSKVYFLSLSPGELLDLNKEIIDSLPKRDKTKATVVVNMQDQHEVVNERLVICRDIYDNQLVVFDKEENELTEFDAGSILASFPAEAANFKKQNAEFSKIIYDAYDITSIRREIDRGLKVCLLNTYKPPFWREVHPVPKDEWLEEPPKQFTIMLEHLIPSPVEREMFLSWLAHAMTTRHQSFLILRGARGTGKTIAMKVAMSVIGSLYFAKDGVASDFDADLKGKRIIGIDDDGFIGTPKGQTLRKRLLNSHMSYNEKHVQTKRSEINFSSSIICSNPEDMFYLNWDERRMVCLTLTDKRLDDVLPERVRDFFDRLPSLSEKKDHAAAQKFLAHLGYYLLNYSKNPKYSNTHSHKGGYFWADVLASLGSQKSFFIEKLLSRESSEYYYTDIYEEWLSSKSMSEKKVGDRNMKTFLEQFHYKDRKVVEVIEGKGPKDWLIKVPAYLHPNEEKDNFEGITLDDFDI